MSQPFNPSNAIRVELGRGRVSVAGGDAQVVVPVDALSTLCASAGEQGVRDFGRRLGAEVGRRVADGISKNASPSELVDHLGGALALSGLGSLSIETWGRALVLKVDGSPLGAAGDALLCAVFEGVLQHALGRDASVVPLSRADATARLLVASARAATTVKGWLASGVSWGDALTRLNAVGAS